MKKFILMFMILSVAIISEAAPPTRQYTYTSGQVINPDHVTTNEDNVYTYLQGGVDTIQDGIIVDADISTSAAIGNNKLATIGVATGGTGSTTASGARSNLGLVIGTDVQAYDAQLADVAGLTPTDNYAIMGNGSNFAMELPTANDADTFTYDTSTASGTQAVTGVGFQPTAVIFFYAQSGTDEIGWGFDISTDQGAIYQTQTAGVFETIATVSIRNDETGSDRTIGEISAFGADGFTITWTKTGSPTGTIDIHYMAFK